MVRPRKCKNTLTHYKDENGNCRNTPYQNQKIAFNKRVQTLLDKAQALFDDAPPGSDDDPSDEKRTYNRSKITLLVHRQNMPSSTKLIKGFEPEKEEQWFSVSNTDPNELLDQFYAKYPQYSGQDRFLVNALEENPNPKRKRPNGPRNQGEVDPRDDDPYNRPLPAIQGEIKRHGTHKRYRYDELGNKNLTLAHNERMALTQNRRNRGAGGNNRAPSDRKRASSSSARRRPRSRASGLSGFDGLSGPNALSFADNVQNEIPMDFGAFDQNNNNGFSHHASRHSSRRSGRRSANRSAPAGALSGQGMRPDMNLNIEKIPRPRKLNDPEIKFWSKPGKEMKNIVITDDTVMFSPDADIYYWLFVMVFTWKRNVYYVYSPVLEEAPVTQVLGSIINMLQTKLNLDQQKAELYAKYVVQNINWITNAHAWWQEKPNQTFYMITSSADEIKEIQMLDPAPFNIRYIFWDAEEVKGFDDFWNYVLNFSDGRSKSKTKSNSLAFNP